MDSPSIWKRALDLEEDSSRLIFKKGGKKIFQYLVDSPSIWKRALDLEEDSSLKIHFQSTVGGRISCTSFFDISFSFLYLHRTTVSFEYFSSGNLFVHKKNSNFQELFILPKWHGSSLQLYLAHTYFYSRQVNPKCILFIMF